METSAGGGLTGSAEAVQGLSSNEADHKHSILTDMFISLQGLRIDAMAKAGEGRGLQGVFNLCTREEGRYLGALTENS